ncbi:hypothetical protein AAVH_24090 [Aphelenchoides avenae]|nr:hypothetical protein AAVH_24090 [Aphelenchus avenae]
MIQKDDVSEEDLSFIFSHGQPLVFHACPNRLVPKLIEAFQQLNEEPPFLHATTMHGNVGSIEVSPPLYVDCFPCTACRRDATVQTRLRTCDAKSECVVETFHIRSNLFTKQLSIELYYMTAGHFNGCEFYARPETASDTAKLWSPIKVIVLVEDPVCGMAVVPSAKVTSKRSTMMLVPEFAVEVYGFLDRIHVGSSLLANRRMHDSLSAAKGILPLHQLSCDLDRENLVSVLQAESG